MLTFKPIHKLSKKLFPVTAIFPSQTATLVWLGMVGFLGSIIIGGFLLAKDITRFSWSEIFQLIHSYKFWFPTVISLIIAQVTMKLSPQQRPWSRLVIVSLLFFLMGRYVIWRSLSTLNLSDPLNSIFSLGLFLIEISVILGYGLRLYLQLKIKPRYREADRMSIAVIEGKYTPSVDILIPTYNEPLPILKRTVVGCQALDYFCKKVYILDDSKRPEVKQLAEELGCEYITRPDNRHAKAGNLNHALTKTSGELIVVFDADFIPTTNFLTRTVGFFQNHKIGLLQTYQSFYNSDPIARNLGLEDLIPTDVESFNRHYQLLRDGIESAICAGTSFIVRRSSLEEVGGFVTQSLSEDYFTGIRLSSKGYKVIYLEENLSAGLAAENISAYIQQKLRWSRGTLQAFFIKENPLSIPGMKIDQRLAHLEGIIQWFTVVFRVIFLVIPLAYAFIGVIPIQITMNEWFSYFIPCYLVQLATFSWLTYRSRSALLSDIYELAQCFPVAVNVIQTLLSPFSVKFKVTPKGILSDRFKFNWELALPLMIFFMVNLVSLGYGLSSSFNLQPEGMQLAWIWSVYNLIIISLALLAMFDVPKPDIYEWFNLQKTVRVFNGNDTVKGVTTKLCEGGAEIELIQPLKLTPSIKIEILETGLILQGKITQTYLQGKFPRIRIEFEQVSLEEYRSLVELLFCRPGRWKLMQTPGELHSLWLLLRVLLRPRFLANRASNS